jgi:hypothetical protein
MRRLMMRVLQINESAYVAAGVNDDDVNPYFYKYAVGNPPPANADKENYDKAITYWLCASFYTCCGERAFSKPQFKKYDCAALLGIQPQATPTLKPEYPHTDEL